MKKLLSVFLSNLQHTNVSMVLCTLELLARRRLNVDPTSVRPVLRDNLYHPNLEVRENIIHMIGFYGEEDFLPYLTNMASHTNHEVSSAARDAGYVIKSVPVNERDIYRMDSIP